MRTLIELEAEIGPNKPDPSFPQSGHVTKEVDAKSSRKDTAPFSSESGLCMKTIIVSRRDLATVEIDIAHKFSYGMI